MPTAATLCNTQSWRLVMSICQRRERISWSKRKKKKKRKGLHRPCCCWDPLERLRWCRCYQRCSCGLTDWSGMAVESEGGRRRRWLELWLGRRWGRYRRRRMREYSESKKWKETKAAAAAAVVSRDHRQQWSVGTATTRAHPIGISCSSAETSCWKSNREGESSNRNRIQRIQKWKTNTKKS